MFIHKNFVNYNDTFLPRNICFIHINFLLINKIIYKTKTCELKHFYYFNLESRLFALANCSNPRLRTFSDLKCNVKCNKSDIQ